MHQKIKSGSSFEAIAGYSRAIVDGEWVFVSGTTGFDYKTMTISADLLEQAHQCFRNLSAALAQAGSSLDDVVRVHYLLTERNQFEVLAPLFGQYFKHAQPAATAMVVSLVDEAMLLEIEVTAKRQAKNQKV